LVPSTICRTFASRIRRSAGKSSTYPYPPSTCTASVVTFIAVSLANSFAIAACWLNGRPASLRLAAVRYRARAAATEVAMSASMNDKPWNSMIGRPNWCRSVAYRTARSSAAWATPVAHAAIPSRPASSAASAIENPRPSSPTSWSRGTRAPSNSTWAVAEPRIPILCSGLAAVTPGVEAGT